MQIQYKTERQRIRQEAKMEEFSLRNTNKNIEPFARIGEEIERNETLKKELLSRTKTDQRNNRDIIK